MRRRHLGRTHQPPDASDAHGIGGIVLRWWHTFVLVGLLLAVTSAVALLEGSRQADLERLGDQALAERTAAAMEHVVQGTLVASATAAALVDEDGLIEPQRFQVFAERLIEQPDVRSVAWERYVPAVERTAVEADLGTRFWERTGDDEPMLVQERAWYLPVVDAWPPAYRGIVGYDLTSEPLRANAVRQARALGSPVITAPTRLAPDDRTGVLAVVPLYRPGLPTGTPSEREVAFTGAVTVGHFTEVLLDDVLQQALPGAQVRVSDRGRLLAQTDEPRLRAGQGAEAVADVGGREWTVLARTADRGSLGNVWWIVGVGTGVTAAVAVALRVNARHASRLRAVNDQLTDLVSAVQHGTLRPPPPAPAGAGIAVRYRPAAAHARLGGDWYDIIRAGERLILAVGDVSGHGIEAVTQMQQVRQVVAAFAHEGHSPAAVLRLADEVLSSDPTADRHFATVWVGCWDPASGVLTYASAGHPPALLAPVAAPTICLSSQPGPPLKLSLDEGFWTDHRVALDPGCRLLVYTDGLVESREGGVDAGVPALRQILSEDGLPLAELADRLMRSRPDPGRDDAALVLLHVPSRHRGEH